MKLEEKYGVDWREYELVGETGIFNFDRGVRQVKSERFAGEIPLVTAGYENAGVADFVDSGNSKLFEANTLTIDMFGNPFYRGYRYYADDNIISLSNPEFSKSTLLYISSNLTYLTKLYNYGKQFRIGELQKVKITLPSQKDGIAFKYIEEFIETLEAERLQTLEAYLLATGLKDYKLTAEERSALDNLGGAGSLSWIPVKFNQLFNSIQQGKRLKKSDQLAGDIPFVMAGTTNTGIVKYISNPVRSFPKNSLTIDIFGNTLYRGYAFGAGDDTGVFWNDDNKFDKYQMIFLTAMINKSLSGKYDFGHKLRASQTMDFEISLPVKTDGIVDFELMTNFIKAVQKTVIKGVVEWTDKRIEATKGVIESE